MNNQHYQTSRENFMISTDKSLLQPDVIHNYLSNESYWAKNIPFEIVERSIEHSLCFGLYDGNSQIGFARIVTDYATFAYLADVFIVTAYRGKGLAKWLMEVVHAHAAVEGIRTFLLVTSDAHGLYEQFGWEVHQHPERVMRRKTRPNFYDRRRES
ncbi:GNAT family N-acetyltransferase [Deminuibacter soli]|uniref:N-acetyltransferase n=1 Tax=Deminuibacter soli TaxID=2291815 RepID=A0A3E1NRD7_9BACT|nr:GNAT family N-acetyltransferase [Deminuibacter soli]RFM30519.1 N-acetyltransferase [Deminuibacter soli]